MYIYGIAVNATRGFDVMRGNKLVRHCGSYEEARKLADGTPGLYIRYYAKKA